MKERDTSLPSHTDREAALEAEKKAERDARYDATLFAGTTLRDRLHASDLAGPVTPARRAQLDRLFRSSAVGRRTLRVKRPPAEVWPVLLQATQASDVPVVNVQDARRAYALASAAFWGEQPKTCVAVTGR